MSIDWSAPIEAVELDTGETTPVVFVEMCGDGTDDVVVAGVPDGIQCFKPNGRPWIGQQDCDYFIRNVRQEVPHD